MKRLSIVVLAACGGGMGGGDDDLPACTPEEQGVSAPPIQFDQVETGELGGSCPSLLITSSTQLSDHFNGNVPAGLSSVDFAIDRIVLGSSNPVLQFAAQGDSEIIVGVEPLCQGIAPQCIAYIMRGTTRDALTVLNCPYRGPDPCNAP